jgi:hypothetical protein
VNDDESQNGLLQNRWSIVVRRWRFFESEFVEDIPWYFKTLKKLLESLKFKGLSVLIASSNTWFEGCIDEIGGWI